MPNKQIIKQSDSDKTQQIIEESVTTYDSKHILRLASKEVQNTKGTTQYTPDTYYYKAMTLFEFDKGVLLINSVPSLYQVFALDFCKKLQFEYKCKTDSEKSLAEITAINFVRVLDIQKKLANLTVSATTRYDVQYVAVLSKELDRAERHYLTSLQALRTLRNPSFELNIKANNAVIGNNQAVQVKSA